MHSSLRSVRYKDKILKYSKLSEPEIFDYLQDITFHIQFIRPDIVAIENRQLAYDLCKDIDVKDTVFVALALELNALLWTGDKKLKEQLHKKGFTQILNY